MSQTEAPLWARYIGDILFLLIFLAVFFFMKPDKAEQDDETDDHEVPNPLEAMLVTEPDEKGQETSDSEKVNITATDGKKQGD